MSKNRFLKIHFFNLLAVIFIAIFLLLNYFDDKQLEKTDYKKEKIKTQKRIKLSTTFIEFSTNISISIYNINKKDKKNVSDIIVETQNIFQYFEKEMNPINKNSTLYKFNNTLKQNINKFFKIPNTLSKLIQESNRIYKISNKKFDIAVFPIMDLWGFSSEKEARIPKKIEINNLLKKITMENVIIKNDSIMFLNESVEIGLGAIAKGFAVDSVASFLEISNNIHDFIIEAGGDLTVRSKNSRIKKVGIRNPREKGTLLDTLSILNGSIATSGDYEKFIIDKTDKNKRYCHIINPLTGYSDSDLISVTVLAKNAYLADAYATTVFLLGAEKGKKFILENNLKGIIIKKSEKIDVYTDEIESINYINFDNKEVIDGSD